MRAYRSVGQHKLEITEVSNGHFIVKGDLTFATLDKAALEHCKFLNSAKHVVIDLQHVGKTDSAGLALMIEWLKMSKKNGAELQLENIPLQLQSLAKLSGFEQYLHLL